MPLTALQLLGASIALPKAGSYELSCPSVVACIAVLLRLVGRRFAVGCRP